jgi:transposase-like protein
MSDRRRRHSAEFKARVALEALQERETLSQLGAKHSVHPGQISQWRKHVEDGAVGLFQSSPSRQASSQTAEISDLYEKIGRLEMELDWLKKKSVRLR